MLLPAVGLLGGISLLLMERLPQDLVVQHASARTLGLADVQLVWLVLSISIATTLAIVVRSDRWLRLYKYTWAAAGVALLLLTFVLGTEINGQRLTLSLRAGQRPAVGAAEGDPRRLPRRLPVGEPAAARRGIDADRADRDPAAAVSRADGRDVGDRPRDRRRPARPRRRAPLLRRVPPAALHGDRRGSATWSSGLLLFLAGAFVMYQLVPHVQTRVDIWLDPFADAGDDGYQIIQALYAFARGGLLGTGLGGGPADGRSRPIETDFPLPRSARSSA